MNYKSVSPNFASIVTDKKSLGLPKKALKFRQVAIPIAKLVSEGNIPDSVVVAHAFLT